MTKAYSKIKCIVVGPIHYNTLNVIRSLEQNAIDTLSILIGKPKSNFVTVSKYVKHWISIEDYNDIGITLDNISGYIKQRLPLIAINDRSASEIDKIYDKINLKFILPNCKNIQGGIIQEMSKFRQIEVASHSGFRTPETIMIRPSDFNKDNFHIPFPCIIKPAKSIIPAIEITCMVIKISFTSAKCISPCSDMLKDGKTSSSLPPIKL